MDLIKCISIQNHYSFLGVAVSCSNEDSEAEKAQYSNTTVSFPYSFILFNFARNQLNLSTTSFYKFQCFIHIPSVSVFPHAPSSTFLMIFPETPFLVPKMYFIITSKKKLQIWLVGYCLYKVGKLSYLI